ncbi:MAG: ATP-binding protein, partial [Ruminococcus sp.]|nr:ATP-binding protein [Ruminococcus sp.]
QLCDELLKKGNETAALGVLENILNSYPDNEEAQRKRNSIKPHQTSQSRVNISIGENFYRKAERANHISKNYEQAIEFYKKAIEVGDRTESAVKDLGMLLLAMYKNEPNSQTRSRALSTISKYKGYLSLSNVSNLNFLEAFYFSIEEFEEYDNVLDRLFNHPSIAKDNKKQSYLFTREAATFIKRHDFENAQAAIEDALTADPANKGVPKLQQVIDNPQLITDETLSSLFSASDFLQLNNGLSSFIQNTLSEYNEFYGVPESIKVDPAKFSKSTLKGVRELIDSVRGRSRERAKYLLTEAKLLSILDPDNITDIKKALILYCNSMAISHLAEESHMDVVRFYYNEAFALSNANYQSLATQVSNALLTYIYSNDQILTQKNKTISVGEVIEIAREQLKYPHLWDALLEISLNNREISAHIVDFLFKSSKSKSEAVKYLNEFHRSTCTQNCNEKSFRVAWDAAREHRINSWATFGNKFRLFENKPVESFSELYLSLTNDLPEWLPSLDTQRLKSIRDRIIPAIEAYKKSSGYRNKETNFLMIEGHINQLIADIEEQPTHISYNYIMPLATYLKDALNTSFNDVKEASEPKLCIKLLSTETVINTDNIVSFQVSLANDKSSSPIRKIHMFVRGEDGVTFVPTNENEPDYNALDGGNEKVYRLSVKIDQAHVTAQALPIHIVVEYETAGNLKEYTQQISLKLYSPNEFVPISNPYAPLADGGPVPVNSNMFYGRKKFIESIVDAFKSTQSKQVIIYGQKRSGKSSVLFHLKEVLQHEGSFFCVCFSLGEILQKLSEFSFYHKILSAIKDEIESFEWENPNTEVPVFNIPTPSEFKEEDPDNPLNTFIKYISLFKTNCKKTSGWHNKNLVIMIDEFTYLYTGIKSGRISDSIMKQWKAITQNPRTQFSVVLVGQDVIPAFKKEDYARNAFGVIQDIRLFYLEDIPARELIENPIRMPNGKSRYVGRAVDRIIEYTSRNPYYIQIFCARLVEYLNDNKSIYITEADVNSVASSFIVGEQALEDDKFDNLIRAGEREDLQEFRDDDVLGLLKQMASLSNLIGFCRRQDLDALKDQDLTNRILNNLADREVIEQLGDDRYKIQVKLFQEWLLNH